MLVVVLVAVVVVVEAVVGITVPRPSKPQASTRLAEVDDLWRQLGCGAEVVFEGGRQHVDRLRL